MGAACCHALAKPSLRSLAILPFTMSEERSKKSHWRKKKRLAKQAAYARAAKKQKTEVNIHNSTLDDSGASSFTIFWRWVWVREWKKGQLKWLRLLWWIPLDIAAATEVGLVVGFNEKTIRVWRKDFYECKGEVSESAQGKHSRPSICAWWWRLQAYLLFWVNSELLQYFFLSSIVNLTPSNVFGVKQSVTHVPIVITLLLVWRKSFIPH